MNSYESRELDQMVAEAMAGTESWVASGAQERLQRDCMALQNELADINQVCRVLRANVVSRESEIARLQQLVLEISRLSGTCIANAAAQLGAAAGRRTVAVPTPAPLADPQREVAPAAGAA